MHFRSFPSRCIRYDLYTITQRRISSRLKMSSKVEDYTKNVLKVVVAQVCQIIGWNSIHQSSLEVLVDTLDRFMQELTKQTYRITELCKLLTFLPSV